MTVKEKAEALFGSDVKSLAMLLHLVQRAENLKECEFRAGWEAAIEEAAAYLDSEHGDDGTQCQDLMQQMIGLVSGVYVLKEAKGPLGIVQQS